MSDDDNEAKRDEMERDSLQKTISEVETALAGSTAGARAVLENFLLNARGRVAVLDKKIKDSQVEKEKHAKEVVEAVSLAQKETALSSREKETFSGFLKEEFFTKKDFARLDQFYAHTWDRLSDGGKDQMSHRVWEGIRRDEYTFTELPASVREKEAKQAYKRLRDSSIGLGSAASIPEMDRDDFVRSYESGKSEEAGKILERKAFKESMFLGADSKRRNHVSAEYGREADIADIKKQTSANLQTRDDSQPPLKSGAKADVDLGDLNLDGVKMAESNAQTSAAEIPNAKGATARSGSSLRGG